MHADGYIGLDEMKKKHDATFRGADWGGGDDDNRDEDEEDAARFHEESSIIDRTLLHKTLSYLQWSWSPIEPVVFQ